MNFQMLTKVINNRYC